MSAASMWKQPSHPGLIEVVKSDKPFGSYAISLVSLPAGAHFTSITDHIFVDGRTYASVEAPGERIIDLNSDLFYVNHSCEPALEFDLTRWEVRVSRTRALTEGDLLTFYYPSTEYHMAQPFDCQCNSPRCKRRIDGAGKMDLSDLKAYWLNEHVETQLGEGNDGKSKEINHATDETVNGAVNESVEARN